MSLRNLYSRWALIAGWSAVTAIGCATSSRGPLAHNPDHPATLAEKYEQQVNSEKTNENPERLPLAYAKWQEQLGNLTEARSSYERVLDASPKSVDAIVGLARVDQLAGRTYEAEQGFSNAIRMRPNDPLVMDAMGQFYSSQERWAEAISVLQKASQQAPTEPDYRYHLAVALARSGDIDGSRPHFAKTVGDAESHYNIGYILYERGQLAEAEQEFLQAILKKPQLEQAQTMYDDVRSERENIQVAGGLMGTRSTLQSRTSAVRSNALPTAANQVQTAVAAANQPTAASERREFESTADPIPSQNVPHQQPPIRQTSADAGPVASRAVPMHRQVPVQPPQWPAAPSNPPQSPDLGSNASAQGSFAPAPQASSAPAQDHRPGITVPQPWRSRTQATTRESYSGQSPTSGAADRPKLTPEQVQQLRNQLDPQL